MQSAATVYIKNLLKTNKDLFKLVYLFNQAPVTYMNKERLSAEVPLPAVTQLMKDSVAQKKISAFMIKRLGLVESFFNFEDPRLRIALLPGDVLEKLLLFAGAAIRHQEIQKIVLKKRLDELKQSIGEDVYFFATKKATLLTSMIPQMPHLEGTSMDRQGLIEVGKQGLEICLANEPQALVERLKLKFPAVLSLNFNQTVSNELKLKCWQFLQRLILKEIASEWKSCFA